MRGSWLLLPVLAGCGLVLDLEPQVSTTSDGGSGVDGSDRLDAGDAGDAAAPGACGVPVHIATAPIESASANASPSLAWTGDGFGLVWHEEVLDLGIRRVFYARLGSDGVPVGAPVPVTGTAANGDHAVIARNEAKLAMVWEDSSFGDSGISLAHLALDGTMTDGPFEVSLSPAQADRPAIAWNGESAYGIAWEDTRDGHYRIYFRSVSVTGSLSSAEVAVSPVGLAARESRVAWSGEAFAVAWHQVAADGTLHVGIASPPDGSFFTFGPGADDPDLAWTGSTWALAYESDNDLAVVYVDPAIGFGTTFGYTISTMPNDDDEPSIEWNGSELGVAFEASNGSQVDVHFAAVDTTGEITRTVQVVDDLPPVSLTPTLAWADEVRRYGVAWAEASAGGELTQDIYFAWICL